MQVMIRVWIIAVQADKPGINKFQPFQGKGVDYCGLAD
jgi:hypothetical protein